MKVLTNVGIAIACALFFTVFAQTVDAAIYYVDFTDGSDVADGLTPGTAWKNLTKATNAASSAPGDSILFQRGETWTGKLTINESGTSGNIVTYGAYGVGSNPIINATGQTYGVDIQVRSYLHFENLTIQGATTGQFLILGGGSSNITIDNVSTSGGSYGIYILSGTNGPITISNSTISSFSVAGIETNNTLNGLTLTNVTTSSGPIGLSMNGTPTGVTITNSNFSSLTNIGISSASTSTITTFNITGSQFNSNTNGGLFLQGNVTGLTISNSFFNSSTSSSGIRVQPATSRIAQTINISNTTANSNGGAGISLAGAGSGSGVTLSDVTASSNTANGGIVVQRTWSNVSIADSVFSNNSGPGLQFYLDNAAATQSAIQVSDTIANNNTGNGFQFFGTLGTGNGVTLTDVTASDNAADGINVKGNWTNIDIDGCIVESNGVDGSSGDGDGISYHDATTGSITKCFISNNIKSAVAHVGSSSLDMFYNVFLHDTNGTIALAYVEGTGTHTFYNNVFYSDVQTGTGLHINSPTGPNVTIKNNIFSGFNKGIERTAGTVTEDHNTIYNSVTPWTGLSQGSNSNTLNPLFSDTSSDNFTLGYNSPLIDQGEVLGGFNQDYLENPIYGTTDRGAFEYQPPYDIGTSEIDSVGNARVYTNGKFRNINATSGTTVDLTVIPVNGFTPGDYSEYMDIEINDWINSGTYYKKFKTTLLQSDSLDYTIGDLQLNTLYRYRINSGNWSEFNSGSEGKVIFEYQQNDQPTEVELMKVEIPVVVVVPTPSNTNTATPTPEIVKQSIVSFPIDNVENDEETIQKLINARIKITDSAGNPLNNANVIIRELNISSITDINGYVNLGNILQEDYSLEISYNNVIYNEVIDINSEITTVALNINPDSSPNYITLIVLGTGILIIIWIGIKKFR